MASSTCLNKQITSLSTYDNHIMNNLNIKDPQNVIKLDDTDWNRRRIKCWLY